MTVAEGAFEAFYSRRWRNAAVPALILGAMAAVAVAVFAAALGDRSRTVEIATTAQSGPKTPNSTSDSTPAPTLPSASAMLAPTTEGPAATVDLVGATWTVVEVDGTGLRPGPATWFVVAPDGSVRGSDACRSFEGEPGTWRQLAGVIEVGHVTYSEPICDDLREASALFGNGDISVNVDNGGSVVMSHSAGTFLIVPLRESAWSDTTTIAGTWTDGDNIFEFAPDGVLRFSREATCDGSYSIDNGRLDVSFGTCGNDAVLLRLPIFRQATAFIPGAGETLLLSGDAGVTRLDRTR